jgi:glycosyltransferase involved in cell wall biosynthesis
MKTIALLLHCGVFEKEFGKRFGLDRDSYLETYRNDWSWDYVSGLKKEGIEPIIYTASQKYSGIYETQDGYRVRFLPLKAWYKWASKFRFPPKRFKIGTYWQELINSVAFKDSLLLGLQEDKVDLLYIQEYWSTRFDFLIDNVKIPIIGIDQGGNDSLAIKSHKQKSLPKAYKLQCQSIEELEKVNSYDGDAVLLTNSVDTDFYSPSPFKDEFRERKNILIVARLFERQKRISDLIRAMQYLDNTWTLEIVGTGSDLKFLQNLASSLGVAQRVRFLGFIRDKSKLREKYQQCSVFALSSAWEAVALVVLEAMSCGAAVVTTDIRTFKNLVIHEKSGIRVPVGEPLALAQGILKCYENRELYGKEAREIVVDSYSKKKMFSQLAEIIKSCPNSATPLRNK